MHVVVVSILVKPGAMNDFIEATRPNVQESLKEPGVLRFDLVQDTEQPNHFLLFEVYREAADQARHKETQHYKRWSSAVKGLLSEDRTRVIYRSVLPHESGWR